MAERPVGVIVSNVYPGGPAARAGLRIGDVITAINGREVANPRALRFRIATLSQGGRAQLDVMRGGRALKLTLRLGAAPEDPPRDLTRLKGRHPLSGTTVANLSPALAEEISVDPMRRGVIVLQVLRGSFANRVGISPGDVVVRVNGNDIETVAHLKRAIRRPSQRWAISVRRDDKVLSMVIEG